MSRVYIFIHFNIHVKSLLLLKKLDYLVTNNKQLIYRKCLREGAGPVAYMIVNASEVGTYSYWARFLFSLAYHYYLVTTIFFCMMVFHQATFHNLCGQVTVTLFL